MMRTDRGHTETLASDCQLPLVSVPGCSVVLDQDPGLELVIPLLIIFQWLVLCVRRIGLVAGTFSRRLPHR